MRAWLLYFEKDIEKNKYNINKYISEGRNKGISIECKSVEEVDLNKDSLPFFVIARMIHPRLSEELENRGVYVFNTSKISTLCNNKAYTYREMNKRKIPIIPSILISNTVEYLGEMGDTLDEKEIQHILYRQGVRQHQKYNDYVIKSTTGHGGKEVMLISEFIQSNVQFGTQELTAASLFPDKYIIQPYISCNNKDVRVYVIGTSIIGAVIREGKDSFKSNYSLGGTAKLFTLNNDQKEIVNSIIHSFDFSYVGIDFLIDEKGNFLLNEIEDVVGARMLFECSDINYVSLYLDYILDVI